jgi:hypothetical protein
MGYLMSARINDRLWHGSVENFIIHWQNQFRLYKRLVPAASHYKDEQKLAMLQVGVHPLRELRQVKNTALLQPKPCIWSFILTKNYQSLDDMEALFVVKTNRSISIPFAAHDGKTSSGKQHLGVKLVFDAVSCLL